MRVRSTILVVIGVGWLVADVYLILSGIILRETRLGIISRFLDSILSIAVHDLVFFVLGWIMLLGWFIPLALGLRSLVRATRAP